MRGWIGSASPLFLRRVRPSAAQVTCSHALVAYGTNQSQSSPEKSVKHGAATPSVQNEAAIGIKLSADAELAQAFDRASKSVGGCSSVEFMKAVQQAYHSTAVLTDVLTQHVKPVLGTTDAAKFAAAAKELEHVLEKELHMKVNEAEEEAEAASPRSRPSVEAMGVLKGRSLIHRLLPLSPHLAEMLFRLWCLQKEKKANLLAVAAPSDYILSPKLIALACLNASKIYLSSDVGADVEMVLSEALLRRSPYTHDAADGDITMHKVPLSHELSATPATHDSTSSNSTEAAQSHGEPAHDADDGVLIKVNGGTLPPVPSSARMCALVTLDVVVPPERYAANYEWYYKRIAGYDSEYEHIAAARMFATNSPKSLAAVLDFMMRMFTGRPVEFMLSKAIGKMIGIPADVRECPPATRKLMCMYMDSSQRWTLSDLLPLAPVVSSKLPTA